MENVIPNEYQLLQCPFENIDEGEHHVPRAFESASRVSMTSTSRPFSLNVVLEPLQLGPFEEESVPYSEESSLEIQDDLELTEDKEGALFAVKVLENYISAPSEVIDLVLVYNGGNNLLKFLRLIILYHYYSENDSPLFQDLLQVCRSAVEFLEDDLEDIFSTYQWIIGYITPNEVLIPFQNTREVKAFFTEKLKFLHFKTSGLSINSFYL